MSDSLIDRLRKEADLDVHAERTASLLTEAADELENRDASFELRWKADMRATKRWREANPGNDLVLPDHADLVVWLLEQLTTQSKR